MAAAVYYFLIAVFICRGVAGVLAFGHLRPRTASLFRIHRLPATVAEAADNLVYPLTQVVSDIDDTLKSSGGVTVAGVALGGIDVQYDRGEFYPGVFQFMWELSLHSVTINKRAHEEHISERGGNTGNSDLHISPPKVAVLTARAEEFKAALEIKEDSKLAKAFRKTGESSKTNPTPNWGVGPVLYGSVNEWIIQYKKGLRKFNNFERLIEQDPTGQIMQVCFNACFFFFIIWLHHTHQLMKMRILLMMDIVHLRGRHRRVRPRSWGNYAQRIPRSCSSGVFARCVLRPTVIIPSIWAANPFSQTN